MVFENGNVNPDSEIPIEYVGNQNKVDGLKLVTEGKSGLVKALKTIKDDLHCEDNDLFVKTDNDKFKVTAVINFTHLIA